MTLLDETLQEEKATDELLTEIADSLDYATLGTNKDDDADDAPKAKAKGGNAAAANDEDADADAPKLSAKKTAGKAK